MTSIFSKGGGLRRLQPPPTLPNLHPEQNQRTNVFRRLQDRVKSEAKAAT